MRVHPTSIGRSRGDRSPDRDGARVARRAAARGMPTRDLAAGTIVAPIAIASEAVRDTGSAAADRHFTSHTCAAERRFVGVARRCAGAGRQLRK